MGEARRVNKIETGVCWTCKHVWLELDWEDGCDGWSCENPGILETLIGEEMPEEKWGYDGDHPCPHWYEEIGVCHKHGEYLKREWCPECAIGDRHDAS